MAIDDQFRLLTGDERFCLHGKDLNFSVLDFWRFEFSNLVDILGYVAEFLVAKALGKEMPDNCKGWTPFDINYKNIRIEVKATSYYQVWREDKGVSERRYFSIRKTRDANSGELIRQNDIYVFCVDEGKDYLSSNPQKLDNWTFYVVPTIIINKECGDQKTISLNRIKHLDGIYRDPLFFGEIKNAIDSVINVLNLQKL